MLTALTTAGKGPNFSWAGPDGWFYASGDFGRGTLKMQYLPNGQSDIDANWIESGATLSPSNPGVKFSLPACTLRPVLLNTITTPNLAYDFASS